MMEEGVNKNEAFKALFDYSPSGMVLVNPSGYFAFANKKFCDITGYTETELREKTHLDLTYPEDVPESKAKAQDIRDMTTDFYMINSKRYIKKTGEVIWIKLWVNGMRDEQGKLVYFVAQIEDITKLKTLESRMENLESRMEYYKSFYYLASVGFITTEVDSGKILNSNHFLENILGYRNDYMKDYYVRPEERRLLIERLKKFGKINDHLVELKAKDGSSRWISMSLTLNKSYERVDGIMSNVTNEILMEKKLHASEAKQLELLAKISTAAKSLAEKVQK